MSTNFAANDQFYANHEFDANSCILIYLTILSDDNAGDSNDAIRQ